MYDVTVIGAAIVDVLAGPVDIKAAGRNSQPVENIKMSFGGDALNESRVLRRLGRNVQLISCLGDDDAGKRVLDHIKEDHISTDSIDIEAGLETAINIVLIDKTGERHFLTNPNGSLRRLSLECIEKYIGTSADIVSFASMFVSSLLTIEKMERFFWSIKKEGKILFADMTMAKNGETFEDIRGLLEYIDVMTPNEAEIAALTGVNDPLENVRLLLEAGVGTAAVKCGASGCIVGSSEGIYSVPAVSGIKCIDSTGAGDTFAAGFLYGLEEGWNAVDCAGFANAAASFCVEQVGAAAAAISCEKIMRRCGAIRPLRVG